MEILLFFMLCTHLPIAIHIELLVQPHKMASADARDNTQSLIDRASSEVLLLREGS